MKKSIIIFAVSFVFLFTSLALLYAGGSKKKEEKAPPAEEKKAEEKKVEEKKEEVPIKKEVKNPDTIIYARYGTIQSLDPHRGYDTSSNEAIMNMYDTLIKMDGSATDKFVPCISEKVPSAKNGLIRDGGKTYVFPIRNGIKFHNGTVLTPEDVAYSFKRAMVVDQDGGAVWMIYQPLLGIMGSRDGDGNIAVDFKDIDRAVVVEGNNVVFHLKTSYPPFLSILTQPWASILCKQWIIENGGWDGTEATWQNYNNPEQGSETLYDKVMGSGPYKLEKWEPGVEISFVRFDDYFSGPASVKHAIIKIVEEWTTRKLMFTAGDADIVQVDTQYWPEMEALEGVKILKDLPTLSNRAFFFNFAINPEANQDIWSGKLDGKGIPIDFFTDINIRKAFACSFDYDSYIEDAYNGNAFQPASPIVEGLPYRDPDTPKYNYDLNKAKEYFKKAWDGKVWENGFKLTISYNTGNAARQIACQMIEETVESLNPKFQIEIRNIDWGVYLNAMIAKKLTMFLIGWVADFADPHNFVVPYMHSQGDFSEWQSYNNPEVDKLIDEGINTVDPAKRKEIYYKLAGLYYEDIPSFQLIQSVERHHMRDWLSGYYWNPLRDVMEYFYMYKKGY